MDAVRNVAGYYYRGFLAIQSAVDLSLIAEVNKSFDPTTTATIQLQRYPYPPYPADAFIPLMKTFLLPLACVTCFMSFVSAMCQEIVLEKENKFKVFIMQCQLHVQPRYLCN